MKTALLIAILLIFLFVPIYANTTVTTDYRQGYIKPLNDSGQLIIDNSLLAVATLNLGDKSPLNPVIYFGGYPNKDDFMNQDGYWFTWQPTGKILCIWVVYK